MAVNAAVENVLKKYMGDDDDNASGRLLTVIISKYLKIWPNLDDENNENEGRNQDTQASNKAKKYNLGLNPQQEYEFKTAFRLIADGSDALDINKIYDLFLMLGYTFQDHDINE